MNRERQVESLFLYTLRRQTTGFFVASNRKSSIPSIHSKERKWNLLRLKLVSVRLVSMDLTGSDTA
jgi:hypothetical protein|uniref:Uncharacterized protein n=1 Tax=Picea glauca TaxID=3330 RepID=A0A124GND3_PICGL|nr:hypothetical protein ABT39_MTgene4486 [Picea glauca]